MMLRRHAAWQDEIDLLADRLRRGLAEHLFGRTRPEGDLARIVDAHHRIGRRVDHAAGDLAHVAIAARLDERGGDLREIGEQIVLALRQAAARCRIENAQRADAMTGRQNQRKTGVEPDPVRPGDQRIIHEPWVERCIRHDKHLLLFECVRAERLIARRLGDRDVVARLEPLSTIIDERNGGAAGAGRGCGEPRQFVEVSFGG